MKSNLKPKQVNVFYAGEAIRDDYDIRMFNTYNYSTITTKWIIIVNKNAVRTTRKMVDSKIR